MGECDVLNERLGTTGKKKRCTEQGEKGMLLKWRESLKNYANKNPITKTQKQLISVGNTKVRGTCFVL